MGIVYIYGLVDSRNELTVENVRYVGKTKNNNPRKRLYKHIEDGKKKKTAPVNKWIYKLFNDGAKPNMIILEECDDSSWKESERKNIKQLRKSNNLLNVRDGGEETGNYYHPSIELYCYDENGDYIKKYNSMTDAVSDVGVSMSRISLALNQRQNKSSANRYWFTQPIKKKNIIFRNAAKRNIPIIQKDLNNNIICEFNSQAEAAKKTGINSKLINKCLRIKTYKQTNNYVWEYK